MSDPLDHRVTKLEYRVDGHDKSISDLKDQANAMSKTLAAIQTNLTQIKWVIIGASIAWGFKFEIVKLLSGLL